MVSKYAEIVKINKDKYAVYTWVEGKYADWVCDRRLIGYLKRRFFRTDYAERWELELTLYSRVFMYGISLEFMKNLSRFNPKDFKRGVFMRNPALRLIGGKTK